MRRYASRLLLLLLCGAVEHYAASVRQGEDGSGQVRPSRVGVGQVGGRRDATGRGAVSSLSWSSGWMDSWMYVDRRR